MPFGTSLNEAFQTFDAEYGSPSPNDFNQGPKGSGLLGGGLNSGWKNWMGPTAKKNSGSGPDYPKKSSDPITGGCSHCSKPAPHHLMNGPEMGYNKGFSQTGGGLLGRSALHSPMGLGHRSMAGGANGDGIDSSTDIRNTIGHPFSNNMDVPDLTSNPGVDDFNVDQNQFLMDVDQVKLPHNNQVTPNVQRTAMPDNTKPVCTDAKCVEILNHLMHCDDCRKRLNDLLNINRNTFLGIDFSKIDYQQVLFYIIIAIVIIAFYELFNALLGRGGGGTRNVF